VKIAKPVAALAIPMKKMRDYLHQLIERVQLNVKMTQIHFICNQSMLKLEFGKKIMNSKKRVNELLYKVFETRRWPFHRIIP
jgi:hypothetical protein